jgi:hypothetical protein
MATITVNTFFDDAPRTAGEAWTMNGGVLTIRTDTRWHANSPASMTGSIGATSISASLGGGIFIDGTKVRWLPYNTGTGNVPAVGTNITQSGVTSSYLLGVYESLTSAPSAVGAEMPVSGFIKFREVTGQFVAGTLIGIEASATSEDVVGWIEIVQQQATANTVPRLGFYRTRGNWFYLDNTTGEANQQLQIPTNGGGSGTRVAGVYIETAPNSGQYELFPALSSTFYTTANLGIDARSKFVFMGENGLITIGSNGTDTVGFLPPSGCKVRIPNIIGRQCAAASPN